jgi:hypothetical protein
MLGWVQSPEEDRPIRANALFWRSSRTPCRGSKQRARLWSRADYPYAIYLRAAQAYMLISMPTGTSTIFGVFQAIRVLPGILAQCLRGVKLRPPRT